MTKSAMTATLTRKISLLLVLASLTPLLVVGGLFAHIFHTSYHDKTLAHIREVVSKHRQSVDTYLEERLSTIQALMNSFDKAELASSERLTELLYVLQSQYGRVFVDLGLVTETGEQVAYGGPFPLDEADYAEAEWFQRAMEGESYISDVFMGIRNQPHFIVAAMQQYNGERYILRATIDFEAFTRLVENIHIGKTGHAFIINTQGEFQTQPRGDIGDCTDRLLRLADAAFAEGPASGGRLVVTEANACDADKPAVFVFATLKQGSWIMVYEQYASDAFSDLYHARVVVVSTLLVGALGIILTAFILTKRVVAYIARLDRDKEKMNEQVVHASKMASLGEMAAGIAHEINNPVAVMVEEAGWVQDLLEDVESGACDMDREEIQRALAQIKTQGSRCKGITQKLLSFARTSDTDRCALDVNALVEESVSLVASKARFANVQLVTRLAARAPYVAASVTEMQQVLLNLINNSLDALEGKAGEVVVATRQVGAMVEIEVRDTGSGIPEAVIDKIFDPFFTTKPVGKGTGLGLAVCYGIIKTLGGDIRVKSVSGEGATITVALPQAEEHPVRLPVCADTPQGKPS